MKKTYYIKRDFNYPAAIIICIVSWYALAIFVFTLFISSEVDFWRDSGVLFISLLCAAIIGGVSGYFFSDMYLEVDLDSLQDDLKLVEELRKVKK